MGSCSPRDKMDGKAESNTRVDRLNTVGRKGANRDQRVSNEVPALASGSRMKYQMWGEMDTWPL